MNKIFTITFALMASAQLQGATLLYELDFEFSGGSEPVGPKPWVTSQFSDIDANTVKLQINAANLSGSEFIRNFYFNFHPDIDPSTLSITKSGGSLSSNVDINLGTNKFKADGDGYFDVRLDFATPANQDRFTAGDSVEFEITSRNPIDVSLFNFDSVLGGGNGTYYAASHIQGIGPRGENSGWIGDGNGDVPVPEPGTVLLIGSMIGSGAYLKRKRDKQNKQ